MYKYIYNDISLIVVSFYRSHNIMINIGKLN